MAGRDLGREARSHPGRPRGAAWLVIALIASMAAACSPAASGSPSASSPGPSTAASETPSGPVELTIAFPSDFEGRGPYHGSFISKLSINVYDSLVRLDQEAGAGGEYIGVLAESWERPEPNVWQFHLYEAAMFADGSPVTADDVVFSYNRIKTDPTSAFASNVDAAEELVAVDAHTVDVISEEPNGSMLTAFDSFAIQSKAWVEAQGHEAADADPMGSGPYRVVEWETDRKVLELRSDFWGTEANPAAFPAMAAGLAADRLIFVVRAEAEAQVTGLLNGELDITPSLPANFAERVEGSDGAHIESVPSGFRYFYIMNPITDAMKSLKVRQAINYAIDIQAIVDGPLQGAATPLDGPLLPGTFSYLEDLQKYPYDPDKARELLAEAGYADGLTIDFPCPDGFFTGETEVCEATSAMLADVGINAPVRRVERATYSTENREEPGYEFFIVRTTFEGGDPSHYDSWLLCSSGRMKYCNEEFSALYEDNSAIVDVDERRETLEEAWRVLMADAPVVFMFAPDLIYGISNKVEWVPESGGDIVPATMMVSRT